MIINQGVQLFNLRLRSRLRERGISPVIGVVLFLAIVVTLAGVVGFFAVGLNDDTNEKSQSGVTSEESEDGYQVQVVDPGNTDNIQIIVNGIERTSIEGSVGNSIDLSEETQICEGDEVTVVGTTGDTETVLSSDTVSSDVNCQLQGTNTTSTATYDGSSWIIETFLENASSQEKQYVLTLSNGSDRQVTETVTLQSGESTTVTNTDSTYSETDPISVGVYSPSSESTSTNSDYTLTGGSVSDSGSLSLSYTGGPEAESYTYTPTGTDGTTVSSTDSSSSISTSSDSGGNDMSLSTSRVKAGNDVQAFATLTTTESPETDETLMLYATETNSSSTIVSESTHTIQEGEEKTVSPTFSISTPNEYVISASLKGSTEIHKVGTITVVKDSSFSVSNVSMTPTNPEIDEEITFSADITNSGSNSDTVTVEFFESESSFVSKDVTVGASSTKTVSATYTPSEERLYKFNLGVVEPAIITEISEEYISDPSQVSISTSPSSSYITPGTKVTLNATASHSDSTVSIEEYQWSIDGNTVTTTTDSYSVTLNTEKLYEYTVIAVASNGDSDIAGDSLRVSKDAGGSGTSEPHTYDKDVSVTSLDGSGTKDDPYVITNDWELQAMNDDTSAHYILGNNIDASGTSEWNGGDGFERIYGLTGSLDGQGYKVLGLTLKERNRNGLIGFLDGGTVQNIGVVDITVAGNYRIGAVVGQNEGGTVINAYSIGGTVTAYSAYAGGVVGYHGYSSTVKRSYATASVSGSYSGGIVGWEYNSTVTNSYWDTQATGQSGSSGGGTGLTTSEMQGSSAESNMSAFDFSNTWYTVEKGYPVLRDPSK